VKFFLSGEIDGTRPGDEIGEKFITACNLVTEKLAPVLENNDYGSEVLELNVIPIIVKLPHEMEGAGWHKERMLFKRKSNSADFRLKIDYDEFCNGNDQHRVNLLIENIISSVLILRKRATKDFDGKQLETDILGAFNKGVDVT